MRLFLYFLFVLLPCCKAQHSKMIVWDADRKLKWSDFKAKRYSDVVSGAVTQLNLEVTYQNNDIKNSLKITCVFNRRESWHRDTSKYGLSHEQLHFDIGEIYARAFRKEVKELSHIRFTPQLVDSLFKKYADLLKREEERYDNQTDFGLDKIRQNEWANKVSSSLESLVKFSQF